MYTNKKKLGETITKVYWLSFDADAPHEKRYRVEGFTPCIYAESEEEAFIKFTEAAKKQGHTYISYIPFLTPKQAVKVGQKMKLIW